MPIYNNLNALIYHNHRLLVRNVWVTCDGEDCGCVAEGDELVFAAAVVDDNLHVVGAQGDVVRPDRKGGGRPIRYLPVTTFKGAKLSD